MSRESGGDTLALFFTGFCVGSMCLMLLLVALNRTYGDGYTEGQIDALTGKVKVELVTHPDSTKTWEEAQE